MTAPDPLDGAEGLPTPRSQLRRSGARRSIRACDEASGTMVSYIVGAAVFLVGATFLFNFALEPPKVAGLEAAAASNDAGNALAVLVGSAGEPSAWNASAHSPYSIQRLGLLESGSTIRMDSSKFLRLAGGSLYFTNISDEYIDYAEAKALLGLRDHDFHLRVFPLAPLANSSNYGIVGYDNFQVAYIGDYTAGLPTDAAKQEQYVLSRLAIGYTNATRITPGGAGSAFPDSASTLRNALVPLLGVGVPQAEITAGSGTKYDFSRVNKTQLAGTLSKQYDISLNTALALHDGNQLGYTKSRELRAIVGVANFSGQAAAELKWDEYVDTNNDDPNVTRDDGDYGYVELSPDGGLTWFPITNSALSRSQDSPGLPFTPEGLYKERTVTLTAGNCGPCMGANEVQVAFHWVADGDTKTGKGWIIDNVQITAAGGFYRTFEKPEFDLLIIGSNVDQNALTSSEIKNAIADFVEIYGGRIIVLGGQQNTNWLQPLFHVGTRTLTTGVGSPDTTHPLLTVPNELAYGDYKNNDKAWDFGGSAEQDLFQTVVGTADGAQILSVSAPGAFGGPSGGGAILLTTYLPSVMSVEQASKFFANAITYGKYHKLYVDYGPDVPSDNVQVAAATRTATMDYTTDGSGEFVDLSFVMYTWRGSYSGTGTAAGIKVPSAPGTPVTTAANKTVTLTWTPPASDGGSPILAYDLYRGTAPGVASYHTTIAAPATSYVDTNLVNGVTYYYNLTAINFHGPGYPSKVGNATPATVPYPPLAPTVVGGHGIFSLSWPAADSGGAAITNYELGAGRTPAADEQTIQKGMDRSHTFNASSSETWYFRVRATNGKGVGNWSAIAGGSTTALPGDPTALTAVGSLSDISLTWVTAPGTIDGYRIYRSISAETPVLLAEIGTNTTFSDKNAVAGTMYYYSVVANNSAGNSAHSPEVAAMRGALPGMPTVAASPSTSAAGRVNLTITAPASMGGASEVLYYKLYRAPLGESPVFMFDIPANGTPSYWDDGGLTPLAAYAYQVAAVTVHGAGLPHTPETLATASGLANPSTLAVTSALGHIGLTWTNVDTTITGYNIFRNASGSPSTYTLLTTIGTNRTYSDWTVPQGQVRQYYVTALNPIGEGGPSNVVTGTNVSLSAPPVITGVPGAGSGKVLLTLTAGNDGGSPILSYEISRRIPAGTWEVRTNLTYASTPQLHTDSGTSLTTYEYRLRTWTAKGWSAHSQTVTVISSL